MTVPAGLPASLPPSVLEVLAGDTARLVDDGRARAEVWRLDGPEGETRYLKRTPAELAADPWEGGALVEAERLRWLASQGAPVASVVAADVGADGDEWLITTALAGTDATDGQHHFDPERLVTALATGLRRFHDALPIDSCPFDTRLSVRLDGARRRVATGRVDADDFDPIHRGRTPADLLALVEQMAASVGERDLVVVHGDPSFPNVVLHHGEVSGFVDLGRCGVADRYLDLAVAARSLSRNLGGHAVGPFFDAYGVDWPEVAKVELYVLLDELF